MRNMRVQFICAHTRSWTLKVDASKGIPGPHNTNGLKPQHKQKHNDRIGVASDVSYVSNIVAIDQPFHRN